MSTHKESQHGVYLLHLTWILSGHIVSSFGIYHIYSENFQRETLVVHFYANKVMDIST